MEALRELESSQNLDFALISKIPIPTSQFRIRFTDPVNRSPRTASGGEHELDHITVFNDIFLPLGMDPAQFMQGIKATVFE